MENQNMKTEYTVDYFIAKFEAIPENLWSDKVWRIGDVACALGHCGVNWAIDIPILPEAMALERLFDDVVTSINDGQDLRYQQPTPKQRILAALQDIKAKQDMDNSIEVAKKAVDDFMDFAKEVKALKEPKREIVYVKLEVETTEANPN